MNLWLMLNNWSTSDIILWMVMMVLLISVKSLGLLVLLRVGRVTQLRLLKILLKPWLIDDRSIILVLTWLELALRIIL